MIRLEIYTSQAILSPLQNLFSYFQYIWIKGDFDLLEIKTPSISLNPYELDRTEQAFINFIPR
jgi:hypothetical protein